MLSGLFRSGGCRARGAFWSSPQPTFSPSLTASAFKRSTHGRKDHMKQPQQHSTAQTTDTPPALSRRRLMGQVVLGGAAALVLSACGGGGSSDSSGDGTSAQEAKLIAAYEKLERGMDWTDVEALVGFPANDSRGSSLLIWVVGDVVFRVSFRTGSLLIASATLKIGSNPTAEKVWEI